MNLIDTVHESLWADRADRIESGELDSAIVAILAGVDPLASTATVRNVVAEVKARIDGLGPLHGLAMDPLVAEIMVNGDGSVWIEREGRLTLTDVRLDEHETLDLIRRLASRVGRTIDLRSPAIDVRLVDGSRLHAVIPPIAIDGPSVTIRRFVAKAISLSELASTSQSEVLQRAVRSGETILVAGATSSGKTTLLNALGAELDPDLRVVTIEDSAELQLPGRHVVRLETRPPTETTSEATIRDLVRHALRMRPDRIICGEMRGTEALDLIQAMNTGHRGSMSTVHANTPADVLRRVETMMLLAASDLPLGAIREQLVSCIDLIVMMAKKPDGSRGVVSLARVARNADGSWAPTIVSMNGQGAQ